MGILGPNLWPILPQWTVLLGIVYARIAKYIRVHAQCSVRQTSTIARVKSITIFLAGDGRTTGARARGGIINSNGRLYRPPISQLITKRADFTAVTYAQEQSTLYPIFFCLAPINQTSRGISRLCISFFSVSRLLIESPVHPLMRRARSIQEYECPHKYP